MELREPFCTLNRCSLKLKKHICGAIPGLFAYDFKTVLGVRIFVKCLCWGEATYGYSETFWQSCFV